MNTIIRDNIKLLSNLIGKKIYNFKYYPFIL